MPLFKNGEVQFYYEREGEPNAPCITLLNGYSRSSSDFRAMAKFLVENGRQVLRVDNRGAGKTEAPAGFQVSDMVNDVVALWNELKIGQSDLLGISYGGVLAMLLASQHPKQVRSLILVSTTPSSFFLNLNNDLSSQTETEVHEQLARYFSPTFAEKNPVLYRSLIKETSKAFLDPQGRERAAQQRNALRRYDFTPLLHSIQCPTLILHGLDDRVIDPEAAEISHRAIKNSQLEIVPEVGHLFLAENPRVLYDKTLRFLKEAK